MALSLAGNHVSALRRGELGRVPLLRALDLSVNNIRRLHADALADNARLRALQLSRNPLAHLPDGCFRGLDALRRLSLSFNPAPRIWTGRCRSPLDRPTLPVLQFNSVDCSSEIGRLRVLIAEDRREHA